VRPSTLLELAKDQRVAMPRDDAEALADFMVVRTAHNLEEYLEKFSVTLSVMQTAEAMERVAFELAEDGHREGIRYMEVRFAPVLNTRGGLTPAEAVEHAVAGLRRAEREHGILGRVIVCALRHLSPRISLDMAALAVEFRDDGVCGFDLAGGELGHPASAHAEAFRYAREHGLRCTCHAGEGDGARSVDEAITACQVHRIGHGTRLFEDPALLAEARDKGIAIECCLTSNLQTHAIASLDTHPLRQYFDAGLQVSLNTDNRLMSGTDLVTEYALAAKHLGFTLAELARVARTSLANAFLPDTQKAALLTTVDAELATITGTAR
jgi:adenosine deaminase